MQILMISIQLNHTLISSLPVLPPEPKHDLSASTLKIFNAQLESDDCKWRRPTIHRGALSDHL